MLEGFLMQLKVLNSSLEGSYNTFLNTNSNTRLYYSLHFKSLLYDFLGAKSHYVVAVDRNRVNGILPLMIKGGKYGEVLNSLPFYGSNGGIIANNMEASFILRECYNQFASTFASSNYIQNPLTIETSGILHDFVDRRLSQWTKLKDKDSLFASFAPSARRNIKKALRENIKVTTTREIDFLNQTHSKNILANNGIPKEKIFFEKIVKCFKDEEYKLRSALFKFGFDVSSHQATKKVLQYFTFTYLKLIHLLY